MTRDGSSGAWTASLGASGRNARYLYEVKVWAPTTGKVETNVVTDPSSVALTLNSTRSVAVDLRDPAFMPSTWRTTPSPRLAQDVDSTIYELHIRDFSIVGRQGPRGPARQLPRLRRERRRAGRTSRRWPRPVSTPCTCCRASTSPPSRRTRPSRRRRSATSPPTRRTASEQQECVDRGGAEGRLQLGLRPLHWTRPGGLLRLERQGRDGGARVAEFRTMVGRAAPGRPAGRARPGLQPHRRVGTGRQVGARQDRSRLLPAPQRQRVRSRPRPAARTSPPSTRWREKLMVDSVRARGRATTRSTASASTSWATTAANMLAVRAALDALTPAEGRRRRHVDLPLRRGLELRRGRRTTRASSRRPRASSAGTGIGTFSDRLRDAVRGGGPFDEDPRMQGFGSGEATDPNGAAVNGDAGRAARSLQHDTDLVELGSGRQPARRSRFRSQTSPGRSSTGTRGRLQRVSRPATPTSPTRSSATSTRTTTRRSSTR